MVHSQYLNIKIHSTCELTPPPPRRADSLLPQLFSIYVIFSSHIYMIALAFVKLNIYLTVPYAGLVQKKESSFTTLIGACS